MADLFKKAKSAEKKVEKKDDKIRILIDDMYFSKIQELEYTQNKLKDFVARESLLKDELKELAMEEWDKKYDSMGENPKSVYIEAKDNTETAQFMLVPEDKYSKIDEQRAKLLRENYGDDVVTETTIYSFNNEILNEYYDEICKLLTKTKKIPKEKLENLIVSNTTYEVRKGIINEAKTFGGANNMRNEIKPVFSLKNPHVIKS